MKLVLGLLLVLFSTMAHAAEITLPAPDGGHGIGYWRGDLQTQIDDELAPTPRKRRLGVQLWYPAVRGTGTPAAWASPAMAAALSQNFPLPAGFENSVKGQSRQGATPVAGRWPVIIFSHGLAFPPTLYKSLFEDLASRGYGILAVSHPHGSALIEYPDGTSISMQRWPSFEEEEKSEAFLAANVETWTADLKATLAWVAAGAGPSPLRGHVDVQRIGMMGH